MIRERVRGDVVRLDKRCIQQIAQRDRVPRLKPDAVFAGPSNASGGIVAI